jgi:hypothetical protein
MSFGDCVTISNIGCVQANPLHFLGELAGKKETHAKTWVYNFGWWWC